MPEIKTFQIGDTVTWTSQAGGKSKTKTGEVIAIVPKLQRMGYSIPDGFRFNGWDGATRSHESYLVQVGKSKRLYWPLVKHLKPWAEVRQCTPEEIIQREKEGWRDNPDYQEPQW